MVRKIQEKDKVCQSDIVNYEDISIMDIIEETLLDRGCQIVSSDMTVSKKELEDTALYLYSLKSNSTNKLYVGIVIDKQCVINDLASDKTSKRVKVPVEIYNKVKQINDSYKKHKTCSDVQISDTAYKKLIAEDILWLEENTKHCCEKDHIITVLKQSIDLLYK